MVLPFAPPRRTILGVVDRVLPLRLEPFLNLAHEITEVGEDEAVFMRKMTGIQYEKKVKDYLRSHLDHIVVHRLRTNKPLTETDLKGLEQTLSEIGDAHGPALLKNLLARSGAPSLAWFVRSLVGMDRNAAQEAFSRFLNDRSLSARQIRFVEMVIDQLTARGVMEPSALYEPPFSNLDTGGPDALPTPARTMWWRASSMPWKLFIQG